MRNKLRWTTALALVAPLAIAAAERPAHAQAAVDCTTLPKPVYVTGSTASMPFMVALGTALSAAATPITIVYKGAGSCAGVDAMVNGTRVTGTANYWTAAGMQSCNLPAPAAPAPQGVVATIGVSDIFATTCPAFATATIPATIGDFHGPNQVMEIVVPKAQTQVSISAEAAYLTFGFGAAAKVNPWLDNTKIFNRGPNSGTEEMIAHVINFPGPQWIVTTLTPVNPGDPTSTSLGASGDMLTQVGGSTAPGSTIGILVAGDADTHRDSIKTLAFQDYKKTCGFWPDSSSSALDKLSVRNGDYPIWGPMHFLATVDATTKVATDANAKAVLDIISGAADPPTGVDLLTLEASVSTVPSCAMAVQRSTEVGPLTPYKPADPCNCFFDKATKAPNTPASCVACTTANEATTCTTPGTSCHHGYCEAN